MLKHKWLILILLLAAALRFFWLTKSPPSLNWDEASIGYNAYSILKTAKDEWGTFLPLSFKAFGEHKLPLMIYASVPGIALFGLNDFGVRVTPAMFGVISVYLIYLLTKELSGSRRIGLTAAFLLAISPWSLHFSRSSFEAGLGLVLLLASLVYLVRSQNKSINLIYSLGFAILSLYSYNAYRILIPLLTLSYCWLGLIKLKLTSFKYWLVIVCSVVLCVPIVFELSGTAGRVRLGSVSITTQKGFYDGVAESRGYTKLPSFLPKLIQNKYTHYAYTVSLNYIKTFSTEFLYFNGSVNSQRSVQGMGLMYLFELPLLVFGLFNVSKNTKVIKYILPVLLLSPLPGAITSDAPSSLRSLSLLPSLLIIESYGAESIYAWLKSHTVWKTPLIAVVTWNLLYFLYLLFMVYPVKYAADWQVGYKEAMGFALKNYSTAKNIYFTTSYGEPYIYALFYSHYDPKTFQTERVEREVDPTGWVHVKSFGKYRFTDFSGLDDPKEIVARNAGTQVLVTNFATLPGDFPRVFSYTSPSSRIMFEGTIVIGKL